MFRRHNHDEANTTGAALEHEGASSNVTSVHTETTGAAVESAVSTISGPDLDMYAADAALESADLITDLERLAGDVDALENLHESIRHFGITRAGLAVVRSDLLSGVSAVPALESLDDDIALESSDAALEGILGDIGSKIAEWAKAAWEGITNIGRKVAEISKGAVAWIGNMFSKAKDAVFGEGELDVHPLTVVLGAVAAIGAFAGAMVLMWGGGTAALAAGAAAGMAKVSGLISKVNLPGIKADVVKGALRVKRVARVAVKKPSTALGWTKAGFMKLLESAKKALMELPGKISALFSKAVEAIKGFGKSIATGFADRVRSAAVAATGYGKTGVLSGRGIRAAQTIDKGAMRKGVAIAARGAAGPEAGKIKVMWETARIYLSATGALFRHYFVGAWTFLRSQLVKVARLFDFSKEAAARTAAAATKGGKGAVAAKLAAEKAAARTASLRTAGDRTVKSAVFA